MIAFRPNILCYMEQRARFLDFPYLIFLRALFTQIIFILFELYIVQSYNWLLGYFDNDLFFESGSTFYNISFLPPFLPSWNAGLTAVCQASASIFLIKMGSRASIQLQETELNEIQSETGCE